MSYNNNSIILDLVGRYKAFKKAGVEASLESIGVSRVIDANLAEENGESVLDLIADNQKKYRIYMSENGNVEAIKCPDTGEWLIKSEK